MRAKFAVLIMSALLLCGCSARVSLADRSFVKAIYVNEENGESIVLILAFISEPETDMASAQGTPKIYEGRGEDIDEAFENAEKKQNKKLFYAQNRLLFMGEKAGENIRHYMDYFGSSALPRDMSLYIADFTSADFAKWEQNADMLVREVEALSEKSSSALFEIKADDNMSGFIPVLKADAETEEIRSDAVLLYYDAAPYAACEDNAMNLAAVLNGKEKHLTLKYGDIKAEAQGVNIKREAVGGKLYVSLNATLLYAADSGRLLKGDELNSAAAYISECAQKQIDEIIKITTTEAKGETKDLFGFKWWYKMKTKAGEVAQIIEASASFNAPVQ